MTSGIRHLNNCRICGTSFEWEQLIKPNGQPYEWEVTICEACEDSGRHRIDTTAQRNAERRAEFRGSLPKLFRDTDKSRLPSLLTTAIDAWNYGPQGLAFAGPSGRGKTRAMFLLLERLARTHSVEFITATDFGHVAAEQFSDDAIERNQAKEKLRAIRSARVLLVDDLGKARLTERVETELFGLFDARTSAGHPTMWTSNLSAQGLKAMVSPDKAAPLLRRLTDFTRIVSL
jgi:DNA replication protein DnaC